MAEACDTYPRNAGMEASKRNRAIRFTLILLEEIPCRDIKSQVEKKVLRIAFVRDQGFKVEASPRSSPEHPAVAADLLAHGGHQVSNRWLTAKLEALKPLDGFALIGNDLGLPD